ncbi:MAG: transglutaminaseTgpA domain-containing protein [Chloroflexota bacterium]|nr:transglutaminaseTgpA domain-containing protein [Chloroflexota bacterium]
MFAPPNLSRLSFRGGWLGLLFFLPLIVLYPTSLQQADWVGLSGQFSWIALLGALFGTTLGNGRQPMRRAMLFGASIGTGSVFLTTILASGNQDFRERAVALAIHVNNWFTQILAGEAANDPTVFVLFLGATAWASAFVGTFALARERRAWDVIVLSGFCLVVNVSLALTSLIGDVVLFTLFALLFLARLHLVTLQERWERANIVPAGEMDWRLFRGALTWTAVLVIMALVTPRVGAAEVLNTAFNTFEGPYHRVEAEWQRFFAGVSGPSRLRGVSFSDSIRLGQAPNLGDRIVMTVTSDAGHFWRAVTYDFYTGAGWRTTEVDRADKVTPATYQGREKQDATFQVDVPHANLLFAANEPTKASVPYQFQSGEDRNYSTSMRVLNRAQANGPYVVTSYVSTADKATLRKAPTAYPPYIASKYLQLPSSLPQRVADLARRVAGGKGNPYDKAEAIETYLRSTHKYSTVVKSPPAGRDPVDYFLFDLKEDFCEYFASSMAVMLREVGVPARMVEGFTTGTFDSDAHTYVVRELNAHAWVEAYFPQYGWIEFEPTPSELPFPRVEQDLPGGSGETSGQGTVRPEDTEGLGRGGDPTDLSGDFGDTSAAAGRGGLDPRPPLAVAAIVLLALLVWVARFQWRFRGLGTVDAAWGKTRLLGTYAGHAPRASQTTYEYAETLGRAVPDASGSLRTIAEARVHERYAAAGATEADRAGAAQAWRRVARALIGLIPARIVRSLSRFVR